MALSADTPRNYSWVGLENSLPVQASTTIYAGSAVSLDSGGEIGPVAASETFMGFSLTKCDNASGSAGYVDARVLVEGEVELTVTGVNDNDDIGDVVYASDDATFTLVASGSVAIGRVSQITNLTAGSCRVRFQGLGARDHT